MNARPDKSEAHPVLPVSGGIFLLRHGHTESGAERRFIGRTEHPLSERGRRQAGFWKRWLAAASCSTIVSSDLGRARETATILASGQKLEVRFEPRLREIHLGQWEGKRFEDIRTTQAEAFEQRGADLAGFRPPGGESFSDLQQRVLPAFLKIVEENRKNAIVVGHAGVNRVILCHLLGMPLQHLFGLGQACGALNILLRRPGGWRLEALNLTPEMLR